MKLKKINASLGLLSIFAMILHISYSIFAYLTMYYNPMMKMFFSVPFIILVCLHAVFGMATLFFQSDSSRFDVYKKQNIKTYLQRISAMLVFPLLILHIKTFSLMQASAEKGYKAIIILLIITELIFFGDVIMHVALSFTNGFITLGLLSSFKVKKVVDIIIYIIGAFAFLISAYAVIRGQAMMFLS